MEKSVFRTFMNKHVIQKTIIFADAFNLKIDGWRPVNSNDHPYRINFFSGGMFVGYIDAVVDEIGESKYVRTDMPFVLNIPFGKIIGSFSTHFELFSYTIKNKKDEKIEGLFEVKKSSEIQDEEYYIASTITLNDLENNCIRVTFNRLASNYTVDINKINKQSHETVRMFFGGGYLSIEHFNYPEFNKKQELAKIKIEFEEDPTRFPISFDFLNGSSYQKDIELKDERLRFSRIEKKLDSIDFNIIGEEIEKNDPAMFSFIDEIRNDLAFLSSGNQPNFFDKTAQLCFSDKYDKFMLDFTRAQKTEIALTYNLLLKKMDSYKRKNNFI